jgi:hypothetical protein
MCCFNILSILRYLEKTQVNPSVLELKKIIQHSARQNARVHLKGDRAHMSSSVAQQGSSAHLIEFGRNLKVLKRIRAAELIARQNQKMI